MIELNTLTYVFIFVDDAIQNVVLRLNVVSSTKNVADLLTKPHNLPSCSFTSVSRELNLPSCSFTSVSREHRLAPHAGLVASEGGVARP